MNGEDLLREVLRRVQWIEDAIVGQRQGQRQGRYERLPGEESREEGSTEEVGMVNNDVPSSMSSRGQKM